MSDKFMINFSATKVSLHGRLWTEEAYLDPGTVHFKQINKYQITHQSR